MDCTLYRIGARFTPLIVNEHNYWRLIISIFLHKDGIQLIMNIFTLLLYGFVLENYFGVIKYLVVFFTSSVFGISLKYLKKGNIFSIYFYQDKVMGGAAAGIYGIFSLNIIYMIDHYTYFNEDRQSIFCNFFWVTFSTFILYSLGKIYKNTYFKMITLMLPLYLLLSYSA